MASGCESCSIRTTMYDTGGSKRLCRPDKIFLLLLYPTVYCYTVLSQHFHMGIRDVTAGFTSTDFCVDNSSVLARLLVTTIP